MIYTTDINNVFVNRKTMVYYTFIIFLARYWRMTRSCIIITL